MPSYNLQVTLRRESLATLNDLHKRTGLPKVQVGNRVLNWFADQDELTQLAILGTFTDRTREEVTRMVLEKMSRLPPAGQQGRVAS